MTTPPTPGPPVARRDVVPVTLAMLWLIGFAILGTLAVVVFLFGVADAPGSGDVCGSSSSTLGECQLAVHENKLSTHGFTVWSGAFAAAAVVCAIGYVLSTVAQARRAGLIGAGR